MTTGEYLVANSTLASGTALQHFLALQIGQGTVFCSQVNVRVEQQELFLTRRAKRRVQAAPAEVSPRRVADQKQKEIAVLYRVPSMIAFADGADELTVTYCAKSALVQQKQHLTVIKGGQ